MSILLQTSFETDTVGARPPGWNNINGTWVVSATDPVTGSNGLIASTNAVGNFVTYTGVAAQAYQKLTFSQRLGSTPTGSPFVDNYMAPAVRCGADGASGYLMLPKSTGAGEISIIGYKITAAGAYTQITQSGAVLTGMAVGDVLLAEVIATGTTVEMRLWKSTGSRPSAASHSITDASYTSGHVGFYRSLAGGASAQMSVDDLTYEDNVAATVPAAPTIGTATAGNGYVDVAFSAPASNGGATILDYTATLSTGETATGASSPVRITASNGTARTATVRARNSAGSGPASTASNSVTPVAPAANAFGPTNSNIVFSPYNWYSDGTGAMQANNIRSGSSLAWSNMRGSYLKFKAAGTTSIALVINTGSLSSVNAAGYPQIAWSVGGGAVQAQTLASGQTSLVLGSSLSTGAVYEVFVWFRGVYITQDGDTAANYDTPNNRFQITSVNLDPGGTLAMPTVKPYRQISFGDSITEGDLSNGGPRSATSQDANLVYPWYLAEALNAEVGIVGFYGKTFSWFTSSWPNYANGYSRLIAGALSPVPDFITVNYGENDGNPGPSSSAVATTLAAVGAAAPGAKGFLFVPFSGKARTNLSAATLPSNFRLLDLNRYEMAPGNTQWSYDGQHPNAKGHANLGALSAGAIFPLLASFSAPLTARTVTFQLATGTNSDGTPIYAANLTGAKIAYYDEASPDLHTVARYKTAAGTFNSTGTCSFVVQSTLAAGATGSVVVWIGTNRYTSSVVVA